MVLPAAHFVAIVFEVGQGLDGQTSFCAGPGNAWDARRMTSSRPIAQIIR
jgi:hypothetical protein